MQCLLCHKEIGSDSLYDLLVSEDVLCSSCRKSWQRIDLHFQIEGVKAYAPWLYEENFSHALIQYKEAGDEALSPVFFQLDKKKLRRKYKNFCVCAMPSSQRKRSMRGFSHLALMYDWLGDVHDPFGMKQQMDQKAKGMERERMASNLFLQENLDSKKKILLVDDTVTTGATLRGALCALGPGRHVEILCASANHRFVKDHGKRMGKWPGTP
ncbi:MAG: hypothetical protein SOI44_03325 [Lactimicrobium sp.]|jgi:predicted amidophosphoribosyltransferase